jgi:hypothetical protein
MRVTSFVAGVAMASVFQTSNPQPRNMGEITVERINVVDHNGKLRLVIANRDRQHPGQIDGKMLTRQRRVAGLMFFDDAGDEVGSLTYNGSTKNGRVADERLTMDQIKQDQVIALGYQESNGQRSAALRVWDRPEQSLGGIVDKFNAATSIPDPVQRDKALAEVEASAPPTFTRVFVGRDKDRSASVSLADANGKPRLKMVVDAAGNPRIEVLDLNGKVMNRWPAQQ